MKFFKCFFKQLVYIHKFQYLFVEAALEKSLLKDLGYRMDVFTFEYDFWHDKPGYCFKVLARKDFLDPYEKHVIVLSSW